MTIVGVLLTGCAVGPNFRSSKAPSTNAYTATPLPEKTAAAPGIGGAAQCFVPGQDIPAQWWTLFHSEALDQLIHLALADSPTLAAAQAKLREAQENRRAQVGVVFSRGWMQTSLLSAKNLRVPLGRTVTTQAPRLTFTMLR